MHVAPTHRTHQSTEAGAWAVANRERDVPSAVGTGASHPAFQLSGKFKAGVQMRVFLDQGRVWSIELGTAHKGLQETETMEPSRKWKLCVKCRGIAAETRLAK